MASGNIVLVNSRWGSTWLETFISNSIKWFTNSPYSHSLVTFPPLFGNNMCIEASGNGVTMQSFDNVYWNNPSQGCDVYELTTISQEKRDAAAAALINELDASYGFLEYPFFMWRRLNELVGRDIKSHDNWSQNGIICSWLCVQYITNCGLGYLFEGYGKCSVSPKDLRNIFDANPDLFKKIGSTF